MSIMANWQEEAELALRAATYGAEDIKECRGGIDAVAKDCRQQVVSEFDKKVETTIIKFLSAHSSHPIFGEESAFDSGAKSFPKPPFWCVDPIDGTANFINGGPYYAVSVGLYDGKEFVAGAMVMPALQEVYVGSKGGGAFCNGLPLTTRDYSLQESQIVECCIGRLPGEREHEFHDKLIRESRSVLRLGCAAGSLAHVAAGKVQAVIGYDLELWDVAAGFVLAKEAGCDLRFKISEQTGKVAFLVGKRPVVTELEAMLRSEGVPLLE
jgi:myo-inositol-1(or 4)-monophosphatase